MPYQDADDDLHDDEFPDEADVADEQTVRCPACNGEIYHDSAACPACGRWLDDAPPASLWHKRPWWWVAVALAGVVAAVAALSLW